jgi:hypothetical protein
MNTPISSIEVIHDVLSHGKPFNHIIQTPAYCFGMFHTKGLNIPTRGFEKESRGCAIDAPQQTIFSESEHSRILHETSLGVLPSGKPALMAECVMVHSRY